MGKLATINAELQQAHQDRNKGNQATYLFFPVFVSFVLVLLASLSSPIIHGLSVVNVDLAVDGHVRFGTWGWCASGVPNTTYVPLTPRTTVSNTASPRNLTFKAQTPSSLS